MFKNSTGQKTQKVSEPHTPLPLRKGFGYQIGWFFGKIPNILWPPPSFFENYIAFFIMDMVAFMQGGTGQIVLVNISLTRFWLHSDYILASLWLHSSYIPTTFRWHTDYILTNFWLHSDYILTIFSLYSDYILDIFWPHFGYIPATFRLHSNYILTTIWLHSGFILVTF